MRCRGLQRVVQNPVQDAQTLCEQQSAHQRQRGANAVRGSSGVPFTAGDNKQSGRVACRHGD